MDKRIDFNFNFCKNKYKARATMSVCAWLRGVRSQCGCHDALGARALANFRTYIIFYVLEYLLLSFLKLLLQYSLNHLIIFIVF